MRLNHHVTMNNIDAMNVIYPISHLPPTAAETLRRYALRKSMPLEDVLTEALVEKAEAVAREAAGKPASKAESPALAATTR